MSFLATISWKSNIGIIVVAKRPWFFMLKHSLLAVEELKISAELVGWCIGPGVRKNLIGVKIFRKGGHPLVHSHNLAISGVLNNWTSLKSLVECRRTNVLFLS